MIEGFISTFQWINDFFVKLLTLTDLSLEIFDYIANVVNQLLKYVLLIVHGDVSQLGLLTGNNIVEAVALVITVLVTIAFVSIIVGIVRIGVDVVSNSLYDRETFKKSKKRR